MFPARPHHRKPQNKVFRKRFFDLEGVNIQLTPMMIHRLNRLVATGMFGNSVEMCCVMLISQKVQDIEYGPSQIVDLIDTKGHPEPKKLYINVDEVNEVEADSEAEDGRELTEDELAAWKTVEYLDGQRTALLAKTGEEAELEREKVEDKMIEIYEKYDFEMPEWMAAIPIDEESVDEEAVAQ